jgi:hypothetical protein
MLRLSQAPVTLKPFWPLSCLELERQGLRPDELIGGSRSILIMHNAHIHKQIKSYINAVRI